MLVLSRRVGEEIVINGNIRITVVAVKGDRVRVGVEAPKDVVVDRAEVHEHRSHFIEIPMPVGHGGDSGVLIGHGVGCNSADDTIVH